jgi:hypothetical protein
MFAVCGPIGYRQRATTIVPIRRVDRLVGGDVPTSVKSMSSRARVRRPVPVKADELSSFSVPVAPANVTAVPSGVASSSVAPLSTVAGEPPASVASSEPGLLVGSMAVVESKRLNIADIERSGLLRILDIGRRGHPIDGQNRVISIPRQKGWRRSSLQAVVTRDGGGFVPQTPKPTWVGSA